jgi:hypothetical protein
VYASKKKHTKNDSSIVTMPLVNPNAARIDIGSAIHAVTVQEERDSIRIKSFGAMTCDLEETAEWLKHCKIDTIAMESTGIYW